MTTLATETHLRRYDTAVWPWREYCDGLWSDCLDQANRFTKGPRDQDTVWHRLFYERFERLRDPYESFVQWWAHELFGAEPTWHQRTPTLRVSTPGRRSVLEYHTDADYGHQPGEVNVWVPLTDAYGSNSIVVEGVAQTVHYGEVLVFDAVRLVHGAMTNRTDHTRLSFDFRLIRKRDYGANHRRSVAKGMELSVGHYFCDHE